MHYKMKDFHIIFRFQSYTVCKVTQTQTCLGSQSNLVAELGLEIQSPTS